MWVKEIGVPLDWWVGLHKRLGVIVFAPAEQKEVMKGRVKIYFVRWGKWGTLSVEKSRRYICGVTSIAMVRAAVVSLNNWYNRECDSHTQSKDVDPEYEGYDFTYSLVSREQCEKDLEFEKWRLEVCHVPSEDELDFDSK